MKKILDDAMAGLVGGVLEVSIFVVAVRYIWTYIARNYASDGWFLSAISNVALFIFALAGTVAAVGALPFWRTYEGRKSALTFSVNALRGIREFYKLRNLIPRAIGGTCVGLWVWFEYLEQEWIQVTLKSIPRNVAFTVGLPSATFCVPELLLIGAASLYIQCLYLFSQEKKIKKIASAIFGNEQNPVRTGRVG